MKFSKSFTRSNWCLVTLVVLAFSSCTTGATPEETISCPYKLPFPSVLGEVKVSQGNSEGDGYSHRLGSAMQFAFDFDLEKGDPVVASRSGKVVKFHE